MKTMIRSALLAMACGDALGVPVEFLSRGELEKTPVSTMRSGGTWNRPAGTWSDDTSLALALADSLAGGWNPEDVMKKSLAWLRDGAYTPDGVTFDVGRTTRAALERFSGGTPALLCGGTGERDNGNGSLMRILPLLFYLETQPAPENPDRWFDLVHQAGCLTHGHPRSRMACGIYLSVARLLYPGCDPAQALESGLHRALSWYERREEYRQEMDHFLPLLSLKNRTWDSLSGSGYVIHTLESALWCLMTSRTLEECILKAVNLGEDTDTTAAVAGGPAGLIWGEDSIPASWLESLRGRDLLERISGNLYRSLLGRLPIRVVEGDITRIRAEGLVNAANSSLLGGGGVDGAIHRAAGPALALEAARLAPCPPGEVRVTGGHNLPVKRILHTVGPVWRGGTRGEVEILASCYRNVLREAVRENLRSLAIPCISTGVYGFPPEKASDIALENISMELYRMEPQQRPQVIIVCYGEDSAKIYRQRIGSDNEPSFSRVEPMKKNNSALTE